MTFSRYTTRFVKRVTDSFTNYKLKAYQEVLKEMKKWDLASWSNNQMQSRSLELKRQTKSGTRLNDLLVEAFALVGEAAWRVIGMRPFDVQVLAGAALHQGKLVEMQIGEGKTLAAVMPVYLNALEGKGVHVLTFNDYLSRRDAEWMGPIYQFLGLSVGFIQEGMSIQERQAAYTADITYVTAKEAGFDYLKDCICYEPGLLVHRPFHYLLVDEADSILIDEARVPLVIAGELSAEADDSSQMAEIVRSLELGSDYETDEYKRNVFLTATGAHKVETKLECGSLYDLPNTALLTSLNCALHADVLLKRDVDYIVRDGKVELIDEFTGRVAEKRHWPDGIQGAVAAKEGLKQQATGRILGTITLQHFLNLYPRICGMTATAHSSGAEFIDTYGLGVAVIPPNRSSQRSDYPDAVFTHKEAKNKALIKEIVTVHKTGRPILIGTSSVEESNELAAKLLQTGVECQVLNAQNDQMEAEIVAGAGAIGAVIVSTNMAGRGVDIVLGAHVAELGGLYVIGTNLHESIRIDNQLRGRAGRQGDPGASRYFVSLEDDLMLRFGIAKAIPAQFRSLKQDEPLDAAVINNRLTHIQRVINGQNFDIRKTLNKYADMLEEQRCIVHKQRTEVLMRDQPLTLLHDAEPEIFDKLNRLIDGKQLQNLEQHITLLHIDRCWADYLDHVAYIREGIHLESIGKRNPADEFHNRLIEAFDELPRKIEEEILSTFRTVNVADKEFSLEREGLKSPSSTWTYIVNDNFFEKKMSIF